MESILVVVARTVADEILNNNINIFKAALHW